MWLNRPARLRVRRLLLLPPLFPWLLLPASRPPSPSSSLLRPPLLPLLLLWSVASVVVMAVAVGAAATIAGDAGSSGGNGAAAGGGAAAGDGNGRGLSILARIDAYVDCTNNASSAAALAMVAAGGCPYYFNGFVCVPAVAAGAYAEVACASDPSRLVRYECALNGEWQLRTPQAFETECREPSTTGSHRGDRVLIDDLSSHGVRRPWKPYRDGEDALAKFGYFRDCLHLVLVPAIAAELAAAAAAANSSRTASATTLAPLASDSVSTIATTATAVVAAASATRVGGSAADNGVGASGDGGSLAGRPRCERHFDGWGCWNDTEPGVMARIQCPPFVPGFNERRRVGKLCTANGSWAYNPSTGRHRWADYSSCVSEAQLRSSEIGVMIYIVGYTVSLVALAVSLAIFVYLRSSLHCLRIVIHKNLFASFVLNNICWLAFYIEASRDTFLVDNSVGCQLLHIVTHYFLLSNYFWMFNEGLYLHTVLVFTFVNDRRLLWLLNTIGWGLPLVLTLAYAVPRSLDPVATAACWTDASTVYTLVLSVPITASIVINFVFLINIVRVLYSKLHAPAQPAPAVASAAGGGAHRASLAAPGPSAGAASESGSVPIRAIRAALILLPLLGLHYIFTPFRPSIDSGLHDAYEIFSAITTSFQGLAVAVLFCFCNQEIVGHVQRKLRITSCFKYRYIQCNANGHSQPSMRYRSEHQMHHHTSTAGSTL